MLTYGGGRAEVVLLPGGRLKGRLRCGAPPGDDVVRHYVSNRLTSEPVKESFLTFAPHETTGDE